MVSGGSSSLDTASLTLIYHFVHEKHESEDARLWLLQASPGLFCSSLCSSWGFSTPAPTSPLYRRLQHPGGDCWAFVTRREWCYHPSSHCHSWPGWGEVVGRNWEELMVFCIWAKSTPGSQPNLWMKVCRHPPLTCKLKRPPQVLYTHRAIRIRSPSQAWKSRSSTNPLWHPVPLNNSKVYFIFQGKNIHAGIGALGIEKHRNWNYI